MTRRTVVAWALYEGRCSAEAAAMLCTASHSLFTQVAVPSRGAGAAKVVNRVCDSDPQKEGKRKLETEQGMTESTRWR